MIDNIHTIILKDNSEYFKLLKLIYGKDGSIYVSLPYLKSAESVVMLSTVNYSKDLVDISFNETIEFDSVDDNFNSLKLSHHKSGLIQVSGNGIKSGIDENGNLKGIGVQSFPLDNPVPGPTIIATIYGYKEFKKVNTIKKDFRIFDIDKLLHNDKMRCLIVSCYCFNETFKRFIRFDENSNMIISLNHPSGTTIPLMVLLPKENCECQSFLGIELYFEKGMEEHASPSYFLSSATGNMRYNNKKELLGDAVFIMNPRQNITTRNHLNYNIEGKSTKHNNGYSK
ncbi:hypothetical protein [Maribacter sp. 2210JD10-5]|uniref:hypothetical protein n=1 Tax=Maribacter sp. 2210JD10-5 TaxID=3386272 RepID=UPI0039BC6AE7